MILSALLASWAFAAGLVDHPIAGSKTTYLDGSWVLGGIQGSLRATVPGDLLTDLQRDGLIPDPLYELNFKNSTLWNGYTWVYLTTFTLTEEEIADMKTGQGDVLLVFDGIKMGALIEVNNQTLGTATDQFYRYTYRLSSIVSALNTKQNVLTLDFDNNINVDGRFMACTGGWDWAPYTNTFQDSNPTPAHTFTKGIWKSVYLVRVQPAAITHVVPHVFYTGEFPTQPLVPGKHAPFLVKTRLHTWAARPVDGVIEINGSWGQQVTVPVKIPAGDYQVTIDLQADASQIELWWPTGTGLGKPTLYQLAIKFTSSGAPTLTAHRRIGFRYFALVTGNDTDPTWVAQNKDAEGTVDQHMLWRVNGAAIYTRGANMIPMEEFEGRMDAEAHRILVQSAVDGNMNTLRVWGGGIFFPDVFYDTCDELGVLVFHDMQFAQEGHDPRVSEVQESEFRHQVRRLSHHPSIVIWDGCNECQVIVGTPTEIYSKFVLTVVADEDKSRVVWPSSPAIGWKAGVNRLDSHPNGRPLIPQSDNIDTGTGTRPTRKFEVHGPYLGGSGFPAVNGNPTLQPFDPHIPLSINPATDIGLQYNSEFASEFGASVFSSFESTSPTLLPKHWGVHGGEAPDNCTDGWVHNCTGVNPMADRNYPCDHLITVYFGEQDLNAVGEQPFKRQLWQCMVGQALMVKNMIESQRTTNHFGSLIWQLGEIWPTGGWGSIEYGTDLPGQVRGGRWKPLHYWLRGSAYTNLFVTCGGDGQCLIKNDSPHGFSGKVVCTEIQFADGKSKVSLEVDIKLSAGPGIVQRARLSSTPDGTQAILQCNTYDTSGRMVSENVVPYAVPKAMKVAKNAAVTLAVAAQPNKDGSINITLSGSQVTVYTTLTTLAHGRFSDNAFLFFPPSKLITFIPFGKLDADTLRKSVRVEHVASYI